MKLVKLREKKIRCRQLANVTYTHRTAYTQYIVKSALCTTRKGVWAWAKERNDRIGNNSKAFKQSKYANRRFSYASLLYTVYSVLHIYSRHKYPAYFRNNISCTLHVDDTHAFYASAFWPLRRAIRNWAQKKAASAHIKDIFGGISLPMGACSYATHIWKMRKSRAQLNL